MIGRNPSKQRTRRISGSERSPDGKSPPPPAVWGDEADLHQDPSCIEYILCHMSDTALLALMVLVTTFLVAAIAQVKGLHAPDGATAGLGQAVVRGGGIHGHPRSGPAADEAAAVENVSAMMSPSKNAWVADPPAAGQAADLRSKGDELLTNNSEGLMNGTTIRRPWGPLQIDRLGVSSAVS